MTRINEDLKEMKKVFIDAHSDNTTKWITSVQKNTSPISSIMKMMDSIQSELLQAQIDLQDGQHQIQRIETIFQFENKSLGVSNSLKSIQINSGNDYHYGKVAELENEIIFIQNDKSNIKKHLESVLLSNSQLKNGISLIDKEAKKKDRVIESVKQENKKILTEKKALETSMIKLNTDLNNLKMEFKEKLNTHKNKILTHEMSASKYQTLQDDLQKQLKESKITIADQEKIILQSKDKIQNLEGQIEFTKLSAKKGVQSYESKVKMIIEEIKNQKQIFEEDNVKMGNDLEVFKEELSKSQQQCEIFSMNLVNKEDEIFHLKSQLMEKHQLEEREKLFKRELDENLNQIRNYKTQIINLNSEKEMYYNKICEQDNAICKLINEIRSLHGKMKTVKTQIFDEHGYENESVYTNTERPNQSTPNSRQSTTADFNEQSQSPDHFNSNTCKENELLRNSEELNNNSEFDSAEDNTIKKLANLLKGQTDYTKSYLGKCDEQESYHKEDQNNAFVIDDFSKYLEEQFQLIKISSDKNILSTKRELTMQ